MSAVLFIGPREDLPLVPLVKEGERPHWRSGAVKDVRPFVARKWKYREGYETQEEAQEEEELQKILPDQDSAIDYYYKI